MGETTSISWTDHTFSPWWGCARVSPGCEHCYAEAFAKRTGNLVWGKQADRRILSDNHWKQPYKWNRAAEASDRRHKVFCASMADVFEDRADILEQRERLWTVIDSTPWLDWQLLTKRPQNVLGMVPRLWLTRWPPNVWLGTTVEDQKRADERIPHLLRVPARVRFLSCEPLLGPVDLWPLVPVGEIQWVIIGGESGPKHRPMAVEWAEATCRSAELSDAKVFVKQAGGARPGGQGGLPDWLWAMKEFPT